VDIFTVRGGGERRGQDGELVGPGVRGRGEISTVHKSKRAAPDMFCHLKAFSIGEFSNMICKTETMAALASMLCNYQRGQLSQVLNSVLCDLTKSS
jgi:hypothetical protein